MIRKLTSLLTAAAVVMFFSLAVMPSVNAGGFTHGTVFNIDGEEYYMDGPPDGPNGATDIPGHEWVQSGPNRMTGKHFNTGPFGASSWWASMEDDGALLYKVDGVIDEWTMEKAESFSQRGYIHYHELVNVGSGMHHPTKVVWLKHTAVKEFYLDGGPHPEVSHDVSPGLDLDFIPNWDMPYMP